MATWLLITGQGDVYHSPSRVHRECEVRGAAVALGSVSNEVCHIQLRPDLTEFQGFAVLSQLLWKARPKRCVISWFGVDWNHELMPSLQKTIERLIELMLEPKQIDRFFCRSRPLDSLEDSHQLVPLIELWRANGGLDLDRDAEAIANHTNGKYMVVSRSSDDQQIRFAEFGKTEWAVYATNHWMVRCIGQPVANQPDYEYGCWTANGYRHAIMYGVPTLSDMDVSVFDAASETERRLRYQRLTVPVRGADNSVRMLTTSCHDLRVNLRPPIN